MWREATALQALKGYPHIVPLRALMYSCARGVTVGVALDYVPGGDLSRIVQ